jgi:hypothetical protein
MARFRVGILRYLIFEDEYVIQKKHWWGWSNWCKYYTEEGAIEDAKWLESRGHQVEWYI